MLTLYIAKYSDHMYPEDNEILGASFDYSEADGMIDHTIDFWKNRDPRHTAAYGEGYHRINRHFYDIDTITLDPDAIREALASYDRQSKAPPEGLVFRGTDHLPRC